MLIQYQIRLRFLFVNLRTVSKMQRLYTCSINVCQVTEFVKFTKETSIIDPIGWRKGFRLHIHNNFDRLRKIAQ